MRIGMIGGFSDHNIGDEIQYIVVKEGIEKRIPNATVVGLSSTLKHPIRPDVLNIDDYIGYQDIILIGPGGVLPGVAMYLDRLGMSVTDKFMLCGCGSFLARERMRIIRKVKKILSPLTFGWCRDPETASLISEAIVAPDASIGFDVQKYVTQDQIPDANILAVCPRYKQPGYMDDSMMEIARDHIAAHIGNKVWWLPASAAWHDVDILLCQRLQQESGKGSIVDAVLDPSNFIRLISQCRGVVTTRKHPGILGQMLGLNVTVFDISETFIRMQEVFGGYASVTPANSKCGYEEITDQSQLAKTFIDEKLPIAKQNVENALDLMCNHIEFLMGG